MTKQELERKVLENELRLQAIVESNLKLINELNVTKTINDNLLKSIMDEINLIKITLAEKYESKITKHKKHINNE